MSMTYKMETKIFCSSYIDAAKIKRKGNLDKNLGQNLSTDEDVHKNFHNRNGDHKSPEFISEPNLHRKFIPVTLQEQWEAGINHKASTINPSKFFSINVDKKHHVMVPTEGNSEKISSHEVSSKTEKFISKLKSTKLNSGTNNTEAKREKSLTNNNVHKEFRPETLFETLNNNLDLNNFSINDDQKLKEAKEEKLKAKGNEFSNEIADNWDITTNYNEDIKSKKKKENGIDMNLVTKKKGETSLEQISNLTSSLENVVRKIPFPQIKHILNKKKHSKDRTYENEHLEKSQHAKTQNFQPKSVQVHTVLISTSNLAEVTVTENQNETLQETSTNSILSKEERFDQQYPIQFKFTKKEPRNDEKRGLEENERYESSPENVQSLIKEISPKSTGKLAPKGNKINQRTIEKKETTTLIEGLFTA